MATLKATVIIYCVSSRLLFSGTLKDAFHLVFDYSLESV